MGQALAARWRSRVVPSGLLAKGDQRARPQVLRGRQEVVGDVQDRLLAGQTGEVARVGAVGLEVQPVVHATDAAGEAFDKAAKILGLDYPGGPIIDKHAKAGNVLAFKFPDSRVGALDFSFSGLKTAFLYFIKDGRKKDPGFVESNLEDICASLEHTIVSYLLRKLEQAVEETGISHVGIAGGVSANSLLRSRFTALGKQKGWRTYIPAFQYCTDNAAMIATSGYYQYLSEDFQSLDSVPFARYDN